jgi:hypothetical protein
MSIICWLLLVAYLSSVSFVFFLTGINWYTIETKKRYSPLYIVMPALYLLNCLTLHFLFAIPLYANIIVCLFFLLALFLGTNFQCIGLTGGIATGKSTVSQILADHGFDIIDADKISKEVSLEVAD